MATYYYGRKILEERGWTFQAVVVDGKRGMLKVFEGMPVPSNAYGDEVPHKKA